MIAVFVKPSNCIFFAGRSAGYIGLGGMIRNRPGGWPIFLYVSAKNGYNMSQTLRTWRSPLSLTLHVKLSCVEGICLKRGAPLARSLLREKFLRDVWVEAKHMFNVIG